MDSNILEDRAFERYHDNTGNSREDFESDVRRAIEVLTAVAEESRGMNIRESILETLVFVRGIPHGN